MMLRQSGDIHRLTPEGCPVHLLHLFSGFQKGFPCLFGGGIQNRYSIELIWPSKCGAKNDGLIESLRAMHGQPDDNVGE